MRRFFVTGGTGFIGRETVKKLETLGICYVLTRQKKENTKGCTYLQGSVEDTELLKAVFEKLRPTDLIHLAWDVKAADFASSPVNARWAKWSTELVRLFLEARGRTVIAGGTCFEYDLSGREVLTEASACWPATFYGMAKLLTYNRVSELCNKYDARFVWGRIFYPYGPGEEKRKFITNVIETLKEGKIFRCKTPRNEADYIHVEDVAGMLYALAENGDAAGIYNICTGNAARIGDILAIAAEMIGSKNQIVCGEQEKMTYTAGDNSKILGLGYRLKYSIRDGLETYFEHQK